jgi:hypothetical protein
MIRFSDWDAPGNHAIFDILCTISDDFQQFVFVMNPDLAKARAQSAAA